MYGEPSALEYGNMMELADRNLSNMGFKQCGYYIIHNNLGWLGYKVHSEHTNTWYDVHDNLLIRDRCHFTLITKVNGSFVCADMGYENNNKKSRNNVLLKVLKYLIMLEGAYTIRVVDDLGGFYLIENPKNGQTTTMMEEELKQYIKLGTVINARVCKNKIGILGTTQDYKGNHKKIAKKLGFKI